MPLLKKLSPIFFSYFILMSVAEAASSIKIENAWSPEAPPVASVMAGYMKINNLSNKNIKIQSAKSNLFKRVEIHLTKITDGMMRMIKQENLNIKANGHIELKSGGLHMMLIGKLKPIQAGSVIPVSLTFDNGEIINVNLKVKNDDEPQMKCGAMMKHH